MINRDDYSWLTGDDAARILAECAAEGQPVHRQLARLQKRLGPGRARLAVAQLELRPRARSKFGPLADRLFFSPELLAEATDLWTARYVASRFAAIGDRSLRLDDFCCGLGGNLIAFSEVWPGTIHAWDRSPEAIALADANIRATMRNAVDRLTFHTSEVELQLPIASGAWHVDPERRRAGRRSTQVGAHAPDGTVLERWWGANLQGAVKLAPAVDPPASWPNELEWEWVSRGRACRQAIAWGGSLARLPGLRRATRVDSSPNPPGWETCDFAGQADASAEPADQARRYLYDPDPSIIAAHLTSALANEHNLSTLGPGAVYLTGDAQLDEPLLARFRVEASMGLRPAKVAAYLHGRRIGRVEVKKRGVDVNPDAFVRRLKLKGEETATLFLTRIGDDHLAIITKRE